MRASLTIAGIEVAIITPVGTAIEGLVAERYAPFMGVIDSPVCFLLLESTRQVETLVHPHAACIDRVGETSFRVVHPSLYGFFDLVGNGIIDVAPSPCALDDAVGSLFGLLAPSHNALLLDARGVIGEGGIHVFLGGIEEAKPVRVIGNRLTNGLVMVRHGHDDRWLAATTPFWTSTERLGPPIEGTLSRFWSMAAMPASGSTEASLVVAQHAVVPTADPEVRHQVLGVSGDVATAAPLSSFPLGQHRLG